MNELTFQSTSHLPLLSNQKRLWIMSQQDKTNPAYNLQHTYHINGEVDYELFNRSMSLLFNRQHTMFSVFRQQDGIPYIDIFPHDVTAELIDFSGLPAEIRKERLFSFASEASRKCFDIEEGPLYRLYLLKEDDKSFFFLSVIHHIIFDGMSMRLFIEELSRIYTNLCRGIDEQPEPLKYQSYDLATWEEESTSATEKKSLEEFWREYLKDCPAELKFPYDHSRNKALTGLGYRESLIIPEAATGKLKRLAKEADSSLFKAMVSVLGVLMGKYTGEDDICIGFPVSSRRGHPSLDEIFGFFINTTVARVKIDGNISFRQYLSSTKDAANKAIVNSKLPFDKIIEAVNPERRPYLNPLFQLSLSWLNNVFPWDLNGSICERVNVPEVISPFDMSFYLWEENNQIKGEIEYSTDLLKHETILRLKNNLLTLINNLVENPDESLKSISLISDTEKKMIDDLNDTQTDYPKDKTIVQLFEDQVSCYSEKTAVVYKGESLTYKQLNGKANQLARTLRDLGVKNDIPVGVFADKSAEIIVGILGILKAGGAYLPIDPEYPLQRVNYLIQESGCRVILTQGKYMNLPIEVDAKLDLNSQGAYNEDNSNTENINSSSDLAYIMYTSGTTGVPKGSMIRHYSVVRLVRNVNYMEMVPEDRILYTSAIVFDVTTYEIWGALLNGMTLYVVDKETILDAAALGEELIKNDITILHLTSALFTQLTEARTDIFAKLKYLLVGGDVLSAYHINKVRRDNPDLKVINCYGPSENTTYSTTYLIDKTHDLNIPIGKPVSNSTVYIFDKHLNYQPVGVMGELYVGGDGLSKGYVNREDLNSSSFIEDQHNPGEKLYRTGDFGRWLPDGNIEFHGRVDNQIKIRGFRVELEEIESVISETEGVIETVIKPVKVEEGDYRLVAFLNVPETFNLDIKDIVLRIKSKLPVYMVPSAFKLMNGFPKTINGKTDKKALTFEISEFEGKTSRDKSDFTPTENKIYRIWCEALKTDDISLIDNFFDVGGNSLLSIRIINQLREEFGIILTFGDFIANSTIGQLGELADSQTAGSGESIRMIHLTGSHHLPLTRNQKRLWLMTKLQPDIPSYIIRLTYKFTGSLNRDLFEKSLDLLFQRHHIMFSVIKEVNSEPYCNIVPAKVKVTFIDLTEIPEELRSGKVTEILIEDSKKPFDLEQGPLYRLFLIQTTPDEYYFHMSIHHIIFDGWSQGIMVNDLSGIYNSLISGKEVMLEELKFQQYDYAQWEAVSEEREESAAFWEGNMHECTPVLNFPYDFARKEQSTGRGSVEPIRFSKSLSEKLRQISREEGTSLFSLMMSGFGVLIHKYSGDYDFNIGLPVTYRPHTMLEKIFGMFVNTVVVRLKYEKGITFREVMKKSGEAIMNAISHQDIPFERVVEIVNPERTTNANPLFQVAFTWQNDLRYPMQLEGIISENIKVRERAPIFDLILYLWENGDFIEGEFEYNLDILKPGTILRLKDHFITLISDLTENRDKAVSAIHMISDAEKRMIGTVNETFTDYSKDKTIIQLFEESAIINPERTAIIFDNVQVTYSELNIKADKLARVLQANNIGQGDFVGLLLRRSPELIISLLALFKAGAAFVPLNLTDPLNRVMSILEAAKIKFVITNTDNDIVLTDRYIRLNIEQLISQSDTLPVTGKNEYSKSTDPAYIIFTSGTTGTPKGVVVNHMAVINLIEWVNRTFKISINDKILWVTNLSFDLSIYDIFGILAAGGSVRIINEEERLDPKKQYDIMLNEGITFWDSAPQSLQQLTLFFKSDYVNGSHNSLRIVFLSGDWIPLSLQPAVTSIFPNAVVVGLGGATEATVWSNYFIIDKINPEWKSIPYGKPIQNARYYVLDENMNHCRIQQPGNLYIGGECLALGYFNDPILTNSKFIQDPFNPGSRLYLTGDKAQWMADGNIEFLGRDDEQIKIRGYRVELGEIKEALLQNKAIKEAILIPDKSDRHNIKVILFFTTCDNIKLEVKDLKSSLRKCLPEYMIPADIIYCPEFPLTTNGKLDTKALLETYRKSLVDKQTTQASAGLPVDLETLSSTQKKLHKIWIDVLKTADFSVEDNFFDAGGNSLLGIRIINQIREEFGIPLTFRELIVNSTICQMGDLIDSRIGDSKESIKLVHLTEKQHLPLTINQKRLWLISKLEPDMPTYIIRLTYKLTGSLNCEIFAKSLDKLFQRHHIVFSVIKETDGEPYSEIIPSEAKVTYIDITGINEDEKARRLNDTINTVSMQSFDLEKGPLYRLYLIQVAADEYYFHMSIHHIIFDGWSQGVLTNDLSSIYNSLIKGEEVGLEELEFQQYDYAQWETGSEERAESVAFWEQNLMGCSPVLNFPYDFPRSEQTTGRGGLEEIRFPKELSDKLRRISREEGSSLFTAIMSAYGLQLHRYSGEDDLNIGMPVAYRPHTKLENIFGMFVNTVVVRLSYDKDITFRELIKQCEEAAMNAISHQDVPFERIVEIVKPERISNANPLFQAAFAWQNNLGVPMNLEGVRCERIPGKERTPVFDIILSLWESGDFIEGEIEYNLDILKPDTIVRLKDHFLTLVNNLVEHIDLPVRSVPMISEEEKRQIDLLNETSTDYPREKTIAQLFEENADLYPDKRAVVDREASLSYKELNGKANQLARTLRTLGVSTNTPVGLFTEKSLDTLIGMIGILKAGGCYMPIDTEYPEQRINFIVKDSGIRLLLTQDKYMGVEIEGVTKLSLNASSSYNEDVTNLQIINSSQSFAYILYTSGTTGTPKGTPVPHRGVVRMVINTNFVDYNPEDRILLSGAVVFDATSFEIWSALLNGGSLYIIDKETLLNPDALGQEIVRNGITTLIITSALFTHLAEIRTDIFGPLRYLIVGGDVLSAPHVKKVRKDNPKLIVINAYGPTENSCTSTAYKIDRDYDHSIPIGKPINNSTAYIFDKDLNYQPVGVVGELFVGGDGLSSGYLNREELNKKSFIEHPYKPGEKLYRTGDLVRWLPDLNIEFHGRVDNQVKIRGFRVELEEIESVISEINGVIETVVNPVRVEEGDYRLVAFLNVAETFNCDTQEILAVIRTKLPGYMIPSAFKFMHGFPITINGKTDRKALIFDTKELSRRESIDLSKLSPAESRIHKIWCEALKTDDITITDNFFDIGGNSLMGIRFINRVREEFGITLSFKELIVNPSINQLGLLIDSRTGGSEGSIKLVHLTETSHLPLTNGQKSIWLISKLQPGVPLYIIPLTYRFKGSLNREVFEKSLYVLFHRHHTVFSVIREMDGEPFCEIVPTDVKVAFTDYSGLTEDDKTMRVNEILNEDSKKTFDLERGPLYRLYLIRTGAEEHYFHMSIHHIIFDGWSHGVFVNDLSEIYNSLIKNEEIRLQALEYQQYDYAQWETNTQVKEESVTFWTENLRDCSPFLNFPYDYPRDEQPKNKGSHESFDLSPDLSEKLRRISKSEDSSLFTTLLCAFGIELHKYSRMDDLNIGLWVAYRPHMKLEKIFGMFVNTVIVRLKYDKGVTFRTLIREANESTLNAISHQNLSFDKVVEIVNPERTSNVNPLFQVVFAWQNNLDESMKLDGIQSEQIKAKGSTTAFDLSLSLTENNNTIEGSVGYNVDIIKRETVIRFKENYIHLLKSLVENPDEVLSEFSLLSEYDKKMLAKFNNTEVRVPDCLVQNLFEAQAKLRPAKTSVIAGISSLTYKELDEKANQLARHLLSLGAKHGDVVGICLDRSVEMTISVLGILKAGCCYLPMDPSFPEERLSYMFKDSGARILITQSSLKDNFPQLTDVPVVSIDTDNMYINEYPVDKPEIPTDSQSLAYIIYTSGSTGRPKGVRVHHQAVVNFLISMSKRPGISEEDRLLGVTTLSFDISGLELFLPVSFGAELVLAERDDIVDGLKLAGLLEMHDITIMQATPATWDIMLGSGWGGKKNMKALCGGEAIQSGLVKNLLPKVNALWNMYGPTETTIWSTCFQIKAAEEKILVGTPIDNTKILILDNFNKQIPVGAIGEVCIGGMGITKGYHNRPDLTLEKFIEFEGESVVYKTGDLGRLLEDGNVELFGRIDNQVKLRGFRIEPAEIEGLLSALPGVREAVVKIHRFDENDERLVGFINADPGFIMSAEEIGIRLSHQLPAYMIPSFYQISYGFPRLPNGKINKKALNLEFTEYEMKREEDQVSLTGTEQRLMALWGLILKTRSFKITDNFFDIGGNSLLGIRVINRIREEFGITINFRDFLSSATIGSLGAYIDARIGDKGNRIILEHLTEKDRLPLTSNQKRLWLISQLHPDVPSYIIPVSYKFTGLLIKELFEKSLGILFERHHIVFSVFRQEGGEPYCKIVPREVKLSYIDYTGLPEDERKLRALSALNEDYRHAFDLSEGPLYRIYLIKTGDEEHYFHMSIHHIIFDGWSNGVFANDLNRIYNSLVRGESIDLENLEYQQYDYALWEANNKVKKESVAFWEENLRGCSPVLNFPYDYPRTNNKTGKGGFTSIRLKRTISKALKQISKEEDTSLFTTLLSAFGAQMHKYTGEDDLNIGLPVANRPHSKLENVLGMFVNTVVVRLKYEKGDTFRDILRRTNETVLNSIAHQDVPFETVVEIVKPERVANTNPLFQVGFAWQNNLGVPISLEGIKSERITGEEWASIFDLNIYLWEKGDYIEGGIEYNMDILKPETIDRLSSHFLTLVENLVENIDDPVNQVTMISEEEVELINESNATATEYPKKKTLAELFEETVVMFPEKIAVSFKDSSLTYRELNEKANQIARTLRSVGVGENIPVGLFADKSLDMIVGILGIVKSGGGYVPVDPEYPEQRINFILSDSGCKVLLIQDKYCNIPVENVKKINLNDAESYHCDKTDVDRINTSSDLAYVMYTSGTTGKPKGSMILQYSVIRLVRNINYIELTSEDRILLTGAIVFDATTFEIWGALLNGGTLYIVEKETILDPKILGEELIKNNITILWLTSALFTQIAEKRTDIFRKLKYVLSGGDIPSATHINKVRKANPDLKFIHCYGPTENTTFSTTFLVEKDYDSYIPIGKPINNSTAYIFDRYMNYQAVGVVGELYVGGDGLSGGYLNRDDLNKTKFINNPCRPGEKLYRTGDYARWLPDGNIEFRGRVDNQLKIRGFRVELEEVESVIMEIDDVIETVVKAVKVEEGDYRLVAFLNVPENFQIGTKEILVQIRAKLPGYMVPSAFKFMHGFPKNVNGKTDRKALIFDNKELGNRDILDLSTLSPTENRIHKIWSEALKADDFSVTDNFFEVGGNSLLAISIMSKIESEFSIELALKAFFDSPRITDLAETIDIRLQQTSQKTADTKKEIADSKIVIGEI